jgi:hypothetical protein
LENLLHHLIINHTTLYRSAVTQVPENRGGASHPVAKILFGVIFAVIVFPAISLLNRCLIYDPTLLTLLLVGVGITIHLEILIYPGSSITCGRAYYTSLLLWHGLCKDIIIASVTLSLANIYRTCYAIKLEILVLG